MKKKEVSLKSNLTDQRCFGETRNTSVYYHKNADI